VIQIPRPALDEFEVTSPIASPQPTSQVLSVDGLPQVWGGIQCQGREAPLDFLNSDTTDRTLDFLNSGPTDRSLEIRTSTVRIHIDVCCVVGVGRYVGEGPAKGSRSVEVGI
jgi:hypothetical protein